MADEQVTQLQIQANLKTKVDKASLSKAKSEIKSTLGDTLANTAFGGMKSALGIATGVTPLKQMGLAVKETTKHLDGFFSAIKRIAIYRAIRAALKAITQGFKEGIQNAYQWAVVTGNQFAKSMDMMATSALYLKNSLGAMTMPLVNTLAPILDALVDKFVALINVVNQFIATLTGASSWTKALKYPKQYADAVGGAAKEIKNQLLGFDELNILKAPSGGSGGASLDYSSMFKNMKLSSTAMEFSKALKEAVKKGDWKEVGSLFSSKFNEMVKSISADEWGTVLGNKLNEVLTLVHTLLHETDFQQVGKKIGEFLSNLKLDWQMIGESWIRWALNIGSAILGVIRNVDWANVGRSFGDFLKGIFNGISSWLTEVDWKQAIKDIGKALKDMFWGVDWNGVGQALFGGLKSALEKAWSWLSNTFRWLLKWLAGDSSVTYTVSQATAGTWTNNSVSTANASGATPGAGGGRGLSVRANGGFPDQGSMFIAGEAGAEFVGNIGGRTGVMNTDQMATALASANEGVVEAVTAIGNAIVGAIAKKDTSVNVNDIRKAIYNTSMRYGV